jgi:hypothetical protein
MSLYQCENCGVIENTALGWCWGRKLKGSPDTRKLCSACAPTKFTDGSDTGHDGRWHGRFPQRFYPLGTMETDHDGNIREKKK